MAWQQGRLDLASGVDRDLTREGANSDAVFADGRGTTAVLGDACTVLGRR